MLEGLGRNPYSREAHSALLDAQYVAFMGQQNGNLSYNPLTAYAAQQYRPPVPPVRRWEEGWRLPQAEWELIP